MARRARPPARVPLPRPDCARRYAGFLADQPHYLDLGVAAPDGAARCSARGEPAPAETGALALALERQPFAIGNVRLDGGRGVITFAHRLSGAPGLVYATVDLAWFPQIAAAARLPEGSSVSLVSADGALLARYPPTPHGIGQPEVHDELFAAVLAAAGEGTTEGPGLDGRARLYAFSALPVTAAARGGYVCVGIPASAAYAPVHRLLGQTAAGLALVAFLLLFAVYKGLDLLVLRHLHTLLEAARRLAAGTSRRARAWRTSAARSRSSRGGSTRWRRPCRRATTNRGAPRRR